MEGKTLHFPLCGRFTLRGICLFMNIAVAEGSSVTCDAECPAHRLMGVGMPIVNGTSKAYWWPMKDTKSIELRGDGLWSMALTGDSERNQWHQLLLKGNFTDDKMIDYIGRHAEGDYRLLIPSLNITEESTCEMRQCRELDIAGSEPDWWSFNCNSAPCGCGDKLSKECKNAEQIKEKCSVHRFTSLAVPLDTPSKVFWRPESEGDYIKLHWGTTTKWTNDPWKVEVQAEQLFTWIEIDINSHFETRLDGQKVRLCKVSFPHINYVEDCSEDKDPDNQILISPSVASDFALGCLKEPQKYKTGSIASWVAFMVVVIVIGVAVPLICIVRKRRRRNRTKRVTKSQEVQC